MTAWEQEELRQAVRKYLAWCFRRETQPRVSELAAILGMTVWQFSRTFKRICGENPSVVLKHEQLKRTRRNITRGKSVNRAGYGAGFSTRRSIYRSFRRAFGTTPRQT